MQRNGQNPIRKVNVFNQAGKSSEPVSLHNRAAGTVLCPSCKTEVPPRPGFRLSALKCPKCGTPLGKK